MTMIVGIHHAQIMIPAGAEAAARAFYGDLLGLRKIEKPTALRVRGGFWLAAGAQQLHVGVDAPGIERPPSRAHVAYEVTDLAEIRTRLARAGIATLDDDRDVPGLLRSELRDPFGNRLELVERR